MDGTQIVGMKTGRLSDYRRDKLGFIFQFYNLVPDLTVRENIEVCEFLSPNPLDAAELMECFFCVMSRPALWTPGHPEAF